MKQNKANGFTLMEVMIAMAILAIALVAVFQLQSQSISMSTDSRFMTTAALLAQSKMVEVEAGATLTNHKEDGDFGPDYPNISGVCKLAIPSLRSLRRLKLR